MEQITYRDPFMLEGRLLVCCDGTWLQNLIVNNHKILDVIRNFSLNEDDIVVASFPKSGTTWVQEIVRQIAQTTSLFDKVRASDIKGRNLEDIFPYWEYMTPGQLEEIRKLTSPRLFKTHLSYHLLPSDVQHGRGKVIYIARNPKDVCVSYFYFAKMMTHLNYRGDLSHLVNTFLDGTVTYGPWLNHVQLYWKHRDEKNVLFITYEELQQIPDVITRRIADFINCPLSDVQLNEVVHASEFDVMKDNDLANYSWLDKKGRRDASEAKFCRKGKTGDWRIHMTSEMSEKMDEQCLKPLDERLQQKLSDSAPRNLP